jgi:hypothetical protein
MSYSLIYSLLIPLHNPPIALHSNHPVRAQWRRDAQFPNNDT